MADINPPTITVLDAQNPTLLVRLLRWFGDTIVKLNAKIDSIKTSTSPISFAAISRALGVNGSDPLNVQGLSGVLAQPQPAGAVRFEDIPTGQLLQTLFDTQLIIVQTGSVYKMYSTIGGNPTSLVELFSSSGPTNMMTLDTAQTVAVTGVKTIDASWLFEVDQTIKNALDTNTILLVQNTNATGTAAAGSIQVKGSTASMALAGHGAGRTTIRCGITLANWSEILGFAGNGILMDTSTATPLVFGTNNVERFRVDSAGLLTLITPSKCILIKPSSAPAANTIMSEIQTNAGASVWSVDIEGDQINRMLKLIGTAANTFLIQPASASGGAKLFVINDTGGTEGVSMRDSGQVNLTGSGAGVSADNSGIAGSLVFEGKQSGTQTSGLTNDGAFQCDLTIDAGTAITAGTSVTANKANGFRQNTRFWRTGTGSPEGVVTAPIGSLWTREDGGASTTLYVKESGAGNTGWIAK